jgi:hypothetical protein
MGKNKIHGNRNKLMTNLDNILELSESECAEIAISMYKKWVETMTPPIYIYQDFPTWLNKIIQSGIDND